MRRIAHVLTLAPLATLLTPALALVLVAAGSGVACDSALNLGEGEAGVAPDGAPVAIVTCAQVCARLIDTCAFGPAAQRDECVRECSLSGGQELLACIMRNPCFTIRSTCGRDIDVDLGENPPGTGTGTDAGDPAGPSEIANCQAACNHALTFDCVTPAEHASCRTKCTVASKSARTTYSSCTFSSGVECGPLHGCYEVLEADGE